MRKLFRMKYEPCNGQCYAHDDVLKAADIGCSPDEYRKVLDGLVAIHERACGNADVWYALDHDDTTGVFVASFGHPEGLELFAGRDPRDVLGRLVDAVRTTCLPPADHTVCHHGTADRVRAFSYAAGCLGG